MQRKISRERIAVIVFVVWILLFILLDFIPGSNKVEVPYVRMDKPYLCTKKGISYEEAKFFINSNEMFICGTIISNNPEFKVRISQFIYVVPTSGESVSGLFEEADFYKLIWFSSNDAVIPLDFSLSPGFYTARFTQGRHSFCELNFEVK
jgi:hypothetical protein